jgi:hypothetical protein
MADKAAERIKYETEVLKTTVLVTVAATGGAISLLLGDHSPLRLGRGRSVDYTTVERRDLAP